MKHLFSMYLKSVSKIFVLAVAISVTYSTKGQENVVPDATELEVLNSIKALSPILQQTWTTTDWTSWPGVTVSNGDISAININTKELEGDVSLIDFNNLTELENLIFYNNQNLTGLLNLNELVDLVEFNGYGCSLSYVDLSSAINIESIYYSFNNSISSEINLPKGEGLSNLKLFSAIGGNLTNLDLTGAVNLNSLFLQNNHLSFSDLENIYSLYPFVNSFSPQTLIASNETLSISEKTSFTLEYITTAVENNYQWQKLENGAWENIIGAINSNKFSISNSTLDDAGQYRVIISNDLITGHSLYSQEFTVNVNRGICSTLVTNTSDSGPGSLRNAIDCANANPDYSVITFDFTTGDSPILVNGDGQYQIDLEDDLVISEALLINAESFYDNIAKKSDVLISKVSDDKFTVVTVDAFDVKFIGIDFFGGNAIYNTGNAIKYKVINGTETSSIELDRCLVFSGLGNLVQSISLYNPTITNSIITSRYDNEVFGTVDLTKSTFYTGYPKGAGRALIFDNATGIVDSCSFSANGVCASISTSSNIEFNNSAFIMLSNSFFAPNVIIDFSDHVKFTNSIFTGGSQRAIQVAGGSEIDVSGMNFENRNVAVQFDLLDNSNNSITPTTITSHTESTITIDLSTTSRTNAQIKQVELYTTNATGTSATPLVLETTIPTSGLVTITVPAGTAGYISALVTDVDGNTSEFSEVYFIEVPIENNTCPVYTTADAGTGSFRQAILDANASLCDTITFQLAEGNDEIVLTSGVLPSITRDNLSIIGSTVTIDGDVRPQVMIDGRGVSSDAPVLLDISNTSGLSIENLAWAFDYVSFTNEENAVFYGDNVTDLLMSGNFFGVDKELDTTFAMYTGTFENIATITLQNSNDITITSNVYSKYNVLNFNKVNGTDFSNNSIGKLKNNKLVSLVHYPVLFSDGENNEVKSNSFGYIEGLAIGFSSETNCLIQGNEIGASEVGELFRVFKACSLFYCPNAQILDNVISTEVGYHTSGAIVSGVSFGALQDSKNVLIKNNIFLNNRLPGIVLGAVPSYEYGLVEFKISENTFINCEDVAIDLVGNANDSIPTPLITDVTSGFVNGTFTGHKSALQRIELFKSNSTGYNATEFLGSVTTFGGSLGNETFAIPIDPFFKGFLIVTSTDVNGNTSEFSLPYGEGYTCTDVLNTNDSGSGSLRYAIECANQDPDHDVISFDFEADVLPNENGQYVIELEPNPLDITTSMDIIGSVKNGTSEAEVLVQCKYLESNASTTLTTSSTSDVLIENVDFEGVSLYVTNTNDITFNNISSKHNIDFNWSNSTGIKLYNSTLWPYDETRNGATELPPLSISDCDSVIIGKAGQGNTIGFDLFISTNSNPVNKVVRLIDNEFAYNSATNELLENSGGVFINNAEDLVVDGNEFLNNNSFRGGFKGILNLFLTPSVQINNNAFGKNRSEAISSPIKGGAVESYIYLGAGSRNGIIESNDFLLTDKSAVIVYEPSPAGADFSKYNYLTNNTIELEDTNVVLVPIDLQQDANAAIPTVIASSVNGYVLNGDFTGHSVGLKRVEVFSSNSKGTEALTLLGVVQKASAGTVGAEQFEVVIQESFEGWVVATVTDTENNTSELSAPFWISVSILDCPTAVLNTNDAGTGSLRELVECYNTAPGLDILTFDLDPSQNHEIEITSDRIDISDSIIFNGQKYVNGLPWVTIVDKRADQSTPLLYNTIPNDVRRVDFSYLGFKDSDALFNSSNLADSCRFENNTGIGGLNYLNNSTVLNASMVNYSSMVTIDNCLFENIEYGVNTNGYVRTYKVTNSRFKDITATDLSGSSFIGAFIQIPSQYNNLIIENNIVEGVETFAQSGYAVNLTFRNNHISSSATVTTGVGLYNGYAYNDTVQNNVFDGVTVGILVDYVQEDEISNNIFRNSTFGIKKHSGSSSSNLTIKNNYFENDSCGICLEENNVINYCTFDGNTFVENNYGLVLGGTGNTAWPQNNTIVNNVFGLDSNGVVNPNKVQDFRIFRCATCFIGELGQENKFYNSPSDAITIENGNAVKLKGIYTEGGQGKPFKLFDFQNGGIQAPVIDTITFTGSGDYLVTITKSGGDTVNLYQSATEDISNPQKHLIQYVSSQNTVTVYIPAANIDNSLPPIVTATITSSSNNTSEFSAPYKVIGRDPGVCYVTTVAESGPGSLNEAINCANSFAGLDTVKFDIPADQLTEGKYVINYTSSITSSYDSIIIDGSTQDGFVDTPVIKIDLNGNTGFSFNNSSAHLQNIEILDGETNIGFYTASQSSLNNVVSYLSGEYPETIRGKLEVYSSDNFLMQLSTLGVNDSVISASIINNNKTLDIVDSREVLINKNIIAGNIYINDSPKLNLTNNSFGVTSSLDYLFDFQNEFTIDLLYSDSSNVLNNTFSPFYHLLGGGLDDVLIDENNFGLDKNNIAFIDTSITGGKELILIGQSEGVQIGSISGGNKIWSAYPEIISIQSYGGRHHTFSNNLIYHAPDLSIIEIKPIEICTVGVDGKLCNRLNQNIPDPIIDSKNIGQGVKGSFTGHTIDLRRIEIFASNEFSTEATELLGYAEYSITTTSWEISIRDDYEGYIVATATDIDGNTSELSEAYYVRSISPDGVCPVVNVQDAGLGSFRQALVDVQGGFCTTIQFDIQDGGDAIVLQSALPSLESLTGISILGTSSTIDGYEYPDVLVDGRGISVDTIISLNTCNDFVIENLAFKHASNNKVIWSITNSSDFVFDGMFFGGDKNLSIHPIVGTGISIDNCSNVSISSSISTGGKFFSVDDSKGMIVENNYISYHPKTLSLPNSSCLGLDIDNLSFLNNVFGDGVSIYMEKGDSGSILNNYFGVDSEGNDLTLFQACTLISCNDWVIRNNIMKNGPFYPVVSLNRSNRIKLSKNIFENNTGVRWGKENSPIYLNGVSSNNGKEWASFTEVIIDATDIRFSGTSDPLDSVEVFTNPGNAYDALVYVGVAKADADGNWNLTVSKTADNDAQFYVNIATDELGNSSPLSPQYSPYPCTVINTLDSGEGSLRQAINDVNANVCSRVEFAISTAGPYVIELDSVVAFVDNGASTSINGLTQVTSGVGSGDQEIIIDGSKIVTGNTTGLGGKNVVFKGLTLSNWNNGFQYLENSSIDSCIVKECAGSGVSSVDYSFEVSNSYIYDCGYGISAGDGTRIPEIIIENVSIGLTEEGIVSTTSNNAIAIVTTDNLIITNSEIVASQANGISTSGVDSVLISNSHLGISKDLSAQGSFTSNAINISGALKVDVKNNTIVNSNASGVYINAVSTSTPYYESTISDNLIGVDQNGRNYTIGEFGVFSQFSNNFSISGNTIKNVNDDGISATSATEVGDIFNNVFEDIVGNGMKLSGLTGVSKISGNKITSIQGHGIELSSLASFEAISNNTIDSTQGKGIEINGVTNSGNINNNIVSNSTSNGIHIQGTQALAITSNKLIGNKEGGLVVSGANVNRIDSNVIYNNAVFGLSHTSGASVDTASYNTIFLNDGVGFIATDGSTTGLFYDNKVGYDTLSNISLNTQNAVFATNSAKVFALENEIAFGDSSGYLVLQTSENKISKTTFEAIGSGKAINLASIGNNQIVAPNVIDYRYAQPDSLIIYGEAVIGDTVEVFLNNGIKENALLYLGNGVTQTDGNWEVVIIGETGFSSDSSIYVVATATDAASNTSELSNEFEVPEKSTETVCTVTTLLEGVEGSLHEAILCANKSAANSNVTIQFDIDTTVELIIPIISELPYIKRFGYDIIIEGPNVLDGREVSLQGTGLNTGLSGDHITIGTLSFENFYTAIAANGSTAITNSSFTNNSTAVVINGNNNAVTDNVLVDQVLAGIHVETGAYNTFTGNYITTNDEDAALTGYQALLLESGTNNNQEAPTDFTYSEGAVTTVTGTANAGDEIHVYLNNEVEQQALDLVVTTIVDANGVWMAEIPTHYLKEGENDFFVATATDDEGNTSALSSIFRVGSDPVRCYVTNENDTDEGSLREAVACATNAGAVGLKATIIFDPDSAIDYNIPVLSVISGVNNYGITLTKDSANSVTLSGTSNGLNLTGSNLIVSGITFDGFSQALVINSGSNNVISDLEISGTLSGITLNGTKATVSNSVIGNVAIGIALNNSTAVIEDNWIGTTKDSIAQPINGYGIALNASSNVQIKNNKFGTVLMGPITNGEQGSAVYGIGGVTNLRVVDNDFTINSDTIASSIETKGIYISGDDMNVASTTNFTSNSPTISGNKIISSQEAIVLHQVNNAQIFDNDLQSINADGIVIDRGINNNISNTRILRTADGFKGISHVNAGNNDFEKPSLDYIDFFEAKGGLIVNGIAPANAIVEFFEATPTPQTAALLLTTVTTNNDGEWNLTIPKEQLNLNGVNYFTATARDASGNTSELSTELSITINACIVTKGADSGDSTLRDAIVKANASECNLILFDITPLTSGIDSIKLITELPSLTKDEVIIDASSESGFSLTTGGVVTVSSEVNTINGVTIDGTHGVPVHGLNTAGLAKGVVINNTTKTTWDYSTHTDNAVAIEVVSGEKALIQLNEFTGDTARAVAGKGIVASGSQHQILENKFSNLNEIAVYVTGNKHSLDSNQALRIGDNQPFVEKQAAFVVENCAGVSFLNNNVDTCGVGFYFITSDSLNVEDLEVSAAVHYGFYIDHCEESELSKCFIDSSAGIGLYANGGVNNIYSMSVSKVAQQLFWIVDETAPTVRRSFMTNSLGNGVLIQNSPGARVDSNFITRIEGNAIEIDAASHNSTVLNNRLGFIGSGNGGAAITLASDGNIVFDNQIYENLGGVLVTGKQNKIVRNEIGKNDTAKYKPSIGGIDLNNAAGNEGIAEPVILGKFTNKIDSIITVKGTGNAGDSIHFYLNKGWYESAIKYIGATAVQTNNEWEITVDMAELFSGYTSYGIATATDDNSNTSELSNQFPLGDCYVVSNDDNGDNTYPPTGSYRQGVSCINVQLESTNMFFAIPETPTIKLETPIDSLYNPYNFNIYGYNKAGGDVVLTQDSLYVGNAPAFRVDIAAGNVYVNGLGISSFEEAVKLKGDGIELNGLRLTGDDNITGVGVQFDGDSIKLNNLNVSYFDLGIEASNKKNLHVKYGSYSNLNRAIDLSNTEGIRIDSASFGNINTYGVLASNTQRTTINGNNFGGLGKMNFASLWVEGGAFVNVTRNGFSNNSIDSSSTRSDEVNGHDIYVSNSVDSLIINSNRFNNGQGRAISFDKNGVYTDFKNVVIEKNQVTNYGSDALYISALAIIDSNSISSISTEQKDTSLYIPELGYPIDTVITIFKGSSHAIVVEDAKDVVILDNHLYSGEVSAVDIRTSENILVSQTVIQNFNDAVLPIEIHKDGTPSNNDLQTPIIDRYEVLLDSCAKFFWVMGTSKAKNKIELFFSDSANFLNEFADTVFADENGDWAYKVPVSLYPKPKEEGLYYIATATDTVDGTSQASNMLYIPPFVDSLFVRTKSDTGAFSLREAVESINCSYFYSVVQFDFGSDFSEQVITLQTPLDTISSFLGFEMDAWGLDQYAVRVDGSELIDEPRFGMYIDTSSDASILRNLSFTDFDTALVVGSPETELNRLDISSTQTNALGIEVLDSIANTSIVNNYIHDIHKAIQIDSSNVKFTIEENLIQFVDKGIHINKNSQEGTIQNNTLGGFGDYGIRIDSAMNKGNYFTKNSIGYDVNLNANASTGVGVILTHAENQTIIDNAIGNITGIGVVIEGASNGNSIQDNKIGALDTLEASPIDGYGIIIRDHETEAGIPTANFVSRNLFLNITEISLTVKEASSNNVSSNLFGYKEGEESVPLGKKAIYDYNSITSNYFNNTIVDYSEIGIELELSREVVISQNKIFSSISTGAGIDIHRGEVGFEANFGVVAPTIESIELIDTSKIIVTGTVPVAGMKVELFKGNDGNQQSVDYVASYFTTTSTAWEIEVSRTYFDLNEKVYFTSTSIDGNGNTSDFGNSVLIEDLLCKIPTDVDLLIDEKTICPGIELELNAGAEGFSYLWEWTEEGEAKTSVDQKLTVTAEAVYGLTIYEGDDINATDICKYIDEFELKHYEKAVDPEYLVASDVFLGDTLILIDLGEATDEESQWSFDGAKAWKDDPADDFWKVIFYETKNYQINQTTIKEPCTTTQLHDVNVLDPFLYVDSTSVFFHTLSIDEFTVTPIPVLPGAPFDVNIKLSKAADLNLMVFSDVGVNVGEQIINENGTKISEQKLTGSDTYQVSIETSDLPGGVYIIRVYSYQISESIKVVVGEITK